MTLTEAYLREAQERIRAIRGFTRDRWDDVPVTLPAALFCLERLTNSLPREMTKTRESMLKFIENANISLESEND